MYYVHNYFITTVLDIHQNGHDIRNTYYEDIHNILHIIIMMFTIYITHNKQHNKPCT